MFSFVLSTLSSLKHFIEFFFAEIREYDTCCFLAQGRAPSTTDSALLYPAHPLCCTTLTMFVNVFTSAYMINGFSCAAGLGEIENRLWFWIIS